MVNEAEKLQRRLEKQLAKSFGKRCEIKDTEDFPELKDGGGRCIVCLSYEQLDKFMRDLVRAIEHNGAEKGKRTSSSD